MKTIVSIKEYRELLNDYTSTDAKAEERLLFIEAYCQNIISNGLEKYITEVRSNKK
jgi:hypothetical protein